MPAGTPLALADPGGSRFRSDGLESLATDAPAPRHTPSGFKTKRGSGANRSPSSSRPASACPGADGLAARGTLRSSGALLRSSRSCRRCPAWRSRSAGIGASGFAERRPRACREGPEAGRAPPRGRGRTGWYRRRPGSSAYAWLPPPPPLASGAWSGAPQVWRPSATRKIGDSPIAVRAFPDKS